MTVFYRSYEYDRQGLKIATSISLPPHIPANSTVNVNAINPSPLANHVRVSVFLSPKVGE